jgi:hypothetical protein
MVKTRSESLHERYTDVATTARNRNATADDESVFALTRAWINGTMAAAFWDSKEENPVKLKLAVMTLIALGCSAAFAQGSATLGFASPGDVGLDCDYEQIQWGGSNNFYAQGTDNLTACSGTINPYATMVGMKVSITPADGSPVLDGPAYAFADNIYDALSGSYTGVEWLLLTQTKPSKLLHHYGWVGYVGFSGIAFLANYGYLTTAIPGQDPTKPVLNQSTAQSGLQSQTKTRVIPK